MMIYIKNKIINYKYIKMISYDYTYDHYILIFLYSDNESDRFRVSSEEDSDSIMRFIISEYNNNCKVCDINNWLDINNIELELECED